MLKANPLVIAEAVGFVTIVGVPFPTLRVKAASPYPAALYATKPSGDPPGLVLVKVPLINPVDLLKLRAAGRLVTQNPVGLSVAAIW